MMKQKLRKDRKQREKNMPGGIERKMKVQDRKL